MNKNVKTVSTEDIIRHRQVEYWNTIISDTFTSLEASPYSRDNFFGQLQQAQFDELGIAEVLSRPAIVSHTASMVSNETQPFFLLHLQLKGSSIHRQDGRQALLGEGDFTLCHTTRPYDVAFTEVNDMLVLRIPEARLKTVIPSPQDLTCIQMPGNEGMSGLTSSLLTRLWDCFETEWDGAYQKKVADMVLNTLAISYAQFSRFNLPEASVRQSRRALMEYFVENHLWDPQLSPGYIAAAFGISTRYLHMLFQHEQETISQYILRRRLEEAKKRLMDPYQARLTVSEIAYSVGFNNVTHFGRVFKEKYGSTPSESRGNNLAKSETG